MIVKLKSPVYDAIEIQDLFLRRSRAREFEKILHDASSAASLAVGHFELTFGAVVHAWTIAKEFADAQNCGKGLLSS